MSRLRFSIPRFEEIADGMNLTKTERIDAFNALPADLRREAWTGLRQIAEDAPDRFDTLNDAWAGPLALDDLSTYDEHTGDEPSFFSLVYAGTIAAIFEDHFTELPVDALSQAGRPRPRPVARTTPGPRRTIDPHGDPLRAVPPPVYVEAIARVDVPAHGMIPCAFPGHDDRTASLKVYDVAERGVWCFGCQRGGSIIDFGATMWALDPRRDFLEIRRRLAYVLLGREVA